MIKYRVKTEKEFLEEFGEKWRTPGFYGCGRKGYYFNPSMNYLLGTEINYNGKDLDINVRGTCWKISNDMIKKVQEIPNYNKKKTLVYD